MLNVAITGHSKGIGKSVYNKFLSEGHVVKGFSRSNGYDISSRQIDIIEETETCDVFINNAWHPTGQTELLMLMLEKWKDKNKLIINIGTKGIFFPTKLPKNTYQDAKIQQQEIIKNAMKFGFPKIMNFMSGIVDTETGSLFSSPQKLNPDDVADLIYLTVMLKDKISIQQMVIDNPGLDWEDIVFLKNTIDSEY
jgi:NADP-dependent 3-hydroxy acid dehydrogenase YdfG